MRALDNPKMRSSCRYLLIYFYRCNIARMLPQCRSISEHLCYSIHRYRSLYIYGVGPLFERLPTACIRFVKQGLQSLYQFQPKMNLLTFGFSRKKRVDDTEECDGEALKTPMAQNNFFLKCSAPQGCPCYICCCKYSQNILCKSYKI